jgi:hypothetical protein
MTLRQKEPRLRDAAHLAFVRASGCCVCPKGVNRPIEAAHVRMACITIGKRETGLAEKPGDQWTVGLCDYHHRTGILAQHKISEVQFWKNHGRNPFEIAMQLWNASGGAARAAERAENPKPVKPCKIKTRDRTKPKRQIPAREMQSRSNWPVGRKIQGRGFASSRPLERRT